MRSYGVTNAAPWAVAPAVGPAGDTYYNTASKTLYLSDGTTWNAVSGGSGGGPLTGAYVACNGTTGYLTGAAVPPNATGIVMWNPAVLISGFSNPLDYGRFLCSVAGRYAISTFVVVSGHAGSAYINCSIAVTHSGTTNRYTGTQGETAGWYNQLSSEAVVDLAAGDIVWVEVQTSGYTNPAGVATAASGAFTITPVGGVKGDPGLPGDLATSHYYYGAPNGVTSAGGNAVPVGGAQIYWAAPLRAAGWHVHANASAIVCDIAGRYAVDVNLSLVHVTGASAYEILEIRKYPVSGGAYEGATFVGPGTNLNWYTQPQGLAMFDMVPGDLITVFVTPNQAAQIDGRGSIVITPVGGAKGDQGVPGIAAISVYANAAARDAANPSPTAGQVCYLDTGDATEGLWTYNGAAWRAVSWNAPWGLIGFTFRNGDLALTAGTPTFWPQTINVVGIARRNYRIDGLVRIQNTSAASDHTASITDGSGNILATAQGGVSGTTSYGTWRPSDVISIVGGMTLQMRVTSSAAATNRASVTSRNWMGIWDDGPQAGAPA